MRRLSLLCIVLGAGCAAGAPQDTTLRLEVRPLPDTARYLQPAVVRAGGEGYKRAAPLPESDLAALTRRDAATVVLSLPYDTWGERVHVAVRVLDTGRALVGVGSGGIPVDGTPLTLGLRTLKDGRERQPMISLAVPDRLAVGEARALTLYGWGLDPGARVQAGGQEAAVQTWHSLAEVVVAARPTEAGPLTIRIENPDGSVDLREDLVQVE